MWDLGGRGSLCHQGSQRGSTSRGTAGKVPLEHLLDTGHCSQCIGCIVSFHPGSSSARVQPHYAEEGRKEGSARISYPVNQGGEDAQQVQHE